MVVEGSARSYLVICEPGSRLTDISENRHKCQCTTVIRLKICNLQTYTLENTYRWGCRHSLVFRDRYNMTALEAPVAKTILKQLSHDPGALSQVSMLLSLRKPEGQGSGLVLGVALDI